VLQACGGTIKGKKIAVLGLAFKANTDDMRDSPALAIVPELLKKGAKLSVYDPEAMEQAKLYLTDTSIHWCEDEGEALKNAEAAVIVTEWQVFKNLEWAKVKKQMKKPVLVDLRNIFTPAEMEKKGFYYLSIGRRAAGEEPRS
jgi:UDPglucose 6-dehydrogenase